MVVKGYKISPYANLQGADLRWANLQGADLQGADLQGANLLWANLQGADLQEADLQGAKLRLANLRWANLQGADLRGANLQGANLRWANLQKADLRGADLQGARLPHFQIPQEGELIVFKKLQKGVVVKLRVPPGARRTATPVGRKCRAEFVEVMEGSGTSKHDGKTEYSPGKIIRPDKYNDDIRVECTHGIHFFLTREEAEEY